MGEWLPYVELGANQRAVSLHCGQYSTCAVLESGRVKCWGRNDQGQLGIGTLGASDNRGDGAQEMGEWLPFVALPSGRTVQTMSCGGASCLALLDNGEVWGWGDNSNHQLLVNSATAAHATPQGPALLGATSANGIRNVSVGSLHACALFADSRVKCCEYQPF